MQRRFSLHAAALISAIASVSLSACSSPILDTVIEPTSTRQQTALVFTAEGLAGISALTPYTKAAIEEALPGYNVREATMETETGTTATLAVFKNGLQVLQILPSPHHHVGAVHGVSASLRGPTGEQIGMSLRETGVNPARCRFGTANWQGAILCKKEENPTITLVFALPRPAVNTTNTSAAFTGATLQRIIWTAPLGNGT